MNIEGPHKTNLVRHKHSGCRDEIKFVVFRRNITAGRLLYEAADSIPNLCERLANTNAKIGNLWESREIHWTAGQRIELSVQHMLHKSKNAKKCLDAFRTATRSNIEDGAYYENRIKPGYTSSASLMFLENLGLPVTDARLTLAAIARAEMHFLHTIEQAGVARIMSKLESLGVPRKDGKSQRRVRTCETVECKHESTKLYVMGGGEADRGGAKKPAVCIVCARKGGDDSHPQRQVTTTRAGRESKPSAKGGIIPKPRTPRTAGKGATGTAVQQLARKMAETQSQSGGAAPAVPKLMRTISAEKRRQTEAEIDAEPEIGETWQHGNGETYKVSRLSEDKQHYVLTPIVDLGKDDIAIEVNLNIAEFKQMRRKGKGRATESWRRISRHGGGAASSKGPKLKRPAEDRSDTDVSENDEETNITDRDGVERRGQRRRKDEDSSNDDD